MNKISWLHEVAENIADSIIKEHPDIPKHFESRRRAEEIALNTVNEFISKQVKCLNCGGEKVSTNYYFRTDGEGAFKYERNDIHIGKRSVGWEPLFQVTKFYSDFKSLVEFYSEESEHLTIVDEYGQKLNWVQLSDRLLSWGTDDEVRKNNKIDHRDKFGYAWVNSEFC